MTFEEFYEEYPEFNHMGSPTSIMEKIVTDDFENRICENCKWYADIGKSYKECELYRISHGDDYGCNRWEDKTCQHRH